GSDGAGRGGGGCFDGQDLSRFPRSEGRDLPSDPGESRDRAPRQNARDRRGRVAAERRPTRRDARGGRGNGRLLRGASGLSPARAARGEGVGRRGQAQQRRANRGVARGGRRDRERGAGGYRGGGAGRRRCRDDGAHVGRDPGGAPGPLGRGRDASDTRGGHRAIPATDPARVLPARGARSPPAARGHDNSRAPAGHATCRVNPRFRPRYRTSEGILMKISRLSPIIAGIAWASAAIATPATPKLHLHKPARGFQMRMESFVVQPSGDREGCEHMVTPNRRPMDVARFELKTTPGTHHFVVWDYLGQAQNPADFWPGIEDPTACVGLGPQDGAVTTANLFGMLSGHVRFQFPQGVAVALQPHANVYANLHYHNYGPTPVTTDAVFNFIPA